MGHGWQALYVNTVKNMQLVYFPEILEWSSVTSDQYYKGSMIVNYDSRVVPDLKIRL